MAYIRVKNTPLTPPPSIDPKPVAKHFDIVLGLDFHMLKVPWPFTPCPITPFVALIFDPMDYIHITLPAIPVYTPEKGFEIARNVPMGGTVYFNGMHKGVAQGALWGMPSVPPFMGKFKGLGKVVSKLNLLHSVIPHPLFLLPKFFHPHEGQLSHGSKTVLSQGMYQSTWLCRAYSCQDIGKILMNNPIGGFYLNFLTAVMVVLPLGKPVLIGGPKEEQQLKLSDLMNALFFLGLVHGLKLSLKMLGKLLTKVLAKIESRFPKFDKFRAAVQPSICKYLGEPVDAASGHMTSYLEGFSLPGPIPFTWEANYYSDSHYNGPLGKNIYHSYDISLLVSEEDELVVMNDAAGRPIVFPLLERGNSFYNPKEKYELHRSETGEYYVSDKTGLQYHFNRPVYHDQGHGKLRSITNRNGFAIRFYYSPDGLLEKITDSSRRDIHFRYNEDRLITAVQVPHPELGDRGILVEMVRYTYDNKNNLKEMYNAEGYYNAFQWEGRHIISRRFNDGTTFTFHYDRHGRCTAALGPEGLYSYTFEYLEGFTVATNSLAHKKTYYHTGGIVSKIVNGYGATQLFTYDEADNQVAETNELGVATTYAFDEKGNMTSMQLPGLGTTEITYNQWQQPVTITLPNGGVWQYEYDDNGNLVQRTNPLGATTKFEYTDGLQSRIINPLGAVTHLQYNNQLLLSDATLPNNGRVKYHYDLLGRLTTITDPAGAVFQREYNLLGNPVQTKDSSGNIVQLQYDSMGNTIAVKDRHQSVAFRYNFFGDVVERRQGNTAIQLGYNKEGQLVHIINEHREIYSFELDEEGNVVTEKGFDGLTRQYIRNAGGQVMRAILPDGSQQAYEYTSAGQVATVYYEKDGSAETFGYNAMGQLISAQNSHASVQLQRDPLGLVTQETSNGIVLNSEYNQLGQRAALKSSMGAALSMQYNNTMSWLEQMEANGWQAQLKYNNQGQVTERSMTGRVTQQNQYDLSGRLVDQVTTQGNKRLQRRYSWDGDRLSGIHDSATGAKQFRHDTYGNLAEVIYGDGSVEYRTPNAVGNLFDTPEQKDRTYDRGGRLLKSKKATYKYDQLGNLVRKTELSGRVWEYEWNAAGMLSGVLRPDGEKVNFKYDALGRRIEKRYKHTITRWVWDGNKPLHEWKEFDARESSADDLITWVFNEDNFTPTAKIKGDKKYSIVADHLGTPIQGYDETGVLIWQREIDSFGNVRMLQGDAGFCGYLYQGQVADVETGLCYNRFRYYDSEEGRYISQDPIGLNGGSRLYGYVHDPNEWVDILGLVKNHCKAKWGTHDYANGGEMKAIDHIWKEHAFHRAPAGKSKFRENINTKEKVRAMVDEAVKPENLLSTAADGTKTFVHTFDHTIGTDRFGNATKQMIVHTDPNGWVRSAYPL
ncbi:MAG: RHS repeat protein [Chitinophaga sp.]|uniref:RHS repeat-associated core domain-containing protein n=1 Tax=Chitinophaga sp. TaxID=1869181 RepID=UPI001B06F1F6|nr:RHS repeat-associated core domain-containing protein [Chitinophaga sp.]MBO9730733.1 RHS repeat protein [Chitinophaga sp.]